MNRYGEALQDARSDPGFLDLISTNYHNAGLSFDEERLAKWCREYYETPTLRNYSPDPAGSPRLREAISRWYKTSGVTVEPDGLTVTASASESYSHIFTGLLDRGDHVLLPSPGYPLFEEIATRRGLEPVPYRLHFTDRWQPDPEEIAASIQPSTGAIVVISPNNPTGVMLEQARVRAIVEICRRHDLLLIVDEVFSEYRYEPRIEREDAPTHSGAPDLPRPSRIAPDVRICTINGVSKLFASPDLKVSWIALSGPAVWVAKAADRLQVENDLYLNGSPLSAHLASRMLTEGDDETARIVSEVARRRDKLLSSLSKLQHELGGGLSFVVPDSGIHLPLVLESEALGISIDDEMLSLRALSHHRLNVHPGYLYGMEGETALVVSFLSPVPVLDDGMGRLKKLLHRGE